MPPSTKYSERRPRMAKALDANTMNGSRLTARMAGTESTANTTSVASIRISTVNSGVARRLAPSRVKSFWTSYLSVVGTNRFTRRRAMFLVSSTSASSTGRGILQDMYIGRWADGERQVQDTLKAVD